MSCRVYRAFTTADDVEHEAKCVQIFISNPQQLRLNENAPNISTVKDKLKDRGVLNTIIHGSYLIANMNQGF